MNELMQMFANMGANGGGGNNGTLPMFGDNMNPWLKYLLGGGMLGMGMFGNILGSNRYNSMQDQVMSLYKKYQDPNYISSLFQRNTVPISNALRHYVGNAVQGDMAQRGLANAGGVYEQALTQALAPYAVENNKLAMQAALAPLGFQFPWGFFQKPQSADLSGLMRMMFMRPPAQQGIVDDNVPTPSPQMLGGITGQPSDVFGTTQNQTLQ